jgi:Tol biopolymer transport system component
MKGVDADCPTKPFGGVEDYDWSPNGQEIAYTAQLGDDIAWSTDLNVYLVPVSGGPAKSITAGNKATDAGPVYSPDGSTIAYRSMSRPGFESDRYRIKLYDRASGKTRTLTEAWDRSPGSIEWSPDGKTLLVTAEEAGGVGEGALQHGRCLRGGIWWSKRAAHCVYPRFTDSASGNLEREARRLRPSAADTFQ